MRRVLVAALAAVAANAFAANPTVETQDSGVTVRLRGISAVDANVAWASGREGTVLRTTDGGNTWSNVSVPDAKDLDFRDIEGFDANTAVALSIGNGAASRVYRTEDGGKTWQLTLQNKDERAFFDCMAFKGEDGWMLGDPVDGHFQVYRTRSGARADRQHDGGVRIEAFDIAEIEVLRAGHRHVGPVLAAVDRAQHRAFAAARPRDVRIDRGNAAQAHGDAAVLRFELRKIGGECGRRERASERERNAPHACTGCCSCACLRTISIAVSSACS